MKTDKYIYFIYQQLQGDLASEDAKALQDWLNLSPENRQIREEIAQSLSIVDEIEPSFDIDIEADYLKVTNQLNFDNKSSDNSTSRNRRIFVYVLVILFGCSLLYYLFSQQNNLPVQLITMSTNAGETLEISLDDGTMVTLNELTSIEYPSRFEVEDRRVSLNGEAYFDVAKSSTQAFIISTTDAEVKVLGTAFNVDAKENNKFVQVTVERGKVELSNKTHSSSVILTAKEQGTLNTSTSEVSEKLLDNLNALAWNSHELSFRNAELADVFETLEQAFSISITYNDSIANCRYSMTKRTVKLDDLLDNLSKLYKFDVIKLGAKEFNIKGGSCD